jgi:hypothetical protein
MTDASGYFDYRGLAAATPQTPALASAIEALSDEQWLRLLAAGQTMRLRAGEPLGDDRALYLLLDGAVRAGDQDVLAPATLGILPFLDGGPWPQDVRVTVAAEVLRIGFDIFEPLAARDPLLGRLLLLELGRVAAARLRALGEVL